MSKKTYEKNVFAVIPAFNECRHIGDVVTRTKRFVDNVIVVDDGSSDKTFEIAEGADADVLRHVINMGKGTVLKTGCDYALKQGADVIVLLDADGQHNPEDIPVFLKALEQADIVFSYRRFNKRMPAILKLGNRLINKTINMLYGISLNDTQCGYRAFRRNVYKKIRWNSVDYTIESEMIAHAASNRIKYAQVPIRTIYHDSYKGTTVFDGAKIVFNMFLLRLKQVVS